MKRQVKGARGPRAGRRPDGASRNGRRRDAAPEAPPRRPPRTEWDLLTKASQEEIEQLVDVLKAVKQGDFTVRLRHHRDGILSQVGELLNDIVGLNEHVSNELLRVGRIVGQEGRMTERASVGPASGSWGASVNAVNQLIGDLVAPTN
jgi:methyl-accepting chemotaxis protein